jgi:hypothetical protein
MRGRARGRAQLFQGMTIGVPEWHPFQQPVHINFEQSGSDYMDFEYVEDDPSDNDDTPPPPFHS